MHVSRLKVGLVLNLIAATAKDCDVVNQVAARLLFGSAGEPAGGVGYA